MTTPWDLDDDKSAEIIPIVNPSKYMQHFCLYTPRDVLKQARVDIRRTNIKINDQLFTTSKAMTEYFTKQEIPLTISTWVLQLCTQAAFAFPLELAQDRFRDSVLGHHKPKSKHYQSVRIRGCVTRTTFSMQLVKKLRAFYVTEDGIDHTTHHVTLVIDVKGTHQDVEEAWVTLHTHATP